MSSIHKIFTIYKATNIINGKIYIGFDSKWPNRQKNHKNSYLKLGQKFYRAIRKYGWDNFEWSVIYQSKDKQHTLTVMEPFFIKQYNSFGQYGYNLTTGGEGTFGYKFNQNTINLFKHQRCGSKNSMYGKIGILNPNFGNKCHDEDFKKAQSLRMKKNNPSLLYRVKCFHCNKEISKSNHTRWHGSKCKVYLDLLQSGTAIK